MKRIAVLLFVICIAFASSICGASTNTQPYTQPSSPSATPASSGSAQIASEAAKWRFKPDDTGQIVSKDEENKELAVPVSQLQIAHFTIETMSEQDHAATKNASQDATIQHSPGYIYTGIGEKRIGTQTEEMDAKLRYDVSSLQTQTPTSLKISGIAIANAFESPPTTEMLDTRDAAKIETPFHTIW